MREELLCPVPYCRNIPLVKLYNYSSSLSVICKDHQNNESTYKINDYLKICQNQNTELFCSNCKKKLSENNYIFFCVNCKKFFDNNCSNKSECYFNNHKIIKTNHQKYFDKIICLLHKKVYTKYCKACKISFCEKCNTKRHENHKMISIDTKTGKEIDEINHKIQIQEEMFKKMKTMITEYLKEMEDKLKIKKLIVQNYINNKLNGNSIENLNNLDLSINTIYQKKIESLYNEKNSEEKLLSLYYYYLMLDIEDDKEENKIFSDDNKLIINKNNNLVDNKDNIKISNIIKDNNDFINNIFKKNYANEDDYDMNIYNSPSNKIHLNSFKSNEMTKSKNIKNIDNNKLINDLNPIKHIDDNNDKDKDKDFPKLEKGPSLDSTINTFQEKSKILCLVTLNSGNLALGFSNGYIKIYNCENIIRTNIQNNNNFNNNQTILQIIDKFKGRRINYIYQLNDSSLLCCTYSKIHHINLKNNDKSFDYLGSIRLSNNEVSKKIIELGNDLIISLGEKNYRKENLSKKKSILKIFNKVNINKENNDECSEYLLSDYDSINSSLSGVSSMSGWENIYSNEEDSPLEDHDEILMEDETIKIYKKNKNFDKINICSVFGTKNTYKKGDEITYEFITTSNKIFDEGEDCVLFYGVMKNKERHGYTFFIQNKIENLPCSKISDSICKLSSKFIGVALQRYKEKDADGIAIIDKNQKELIRIYRGFSIGLMIKPLGSRYIFFSTNKSKDTNKCDVIRLINELTERLQSNDEKIVCQIKTRFNTLAQLKPKIRGIKDNSLFYFALSSNKTLYIISIKK